MRLVESKDCELKSGFYAIDIDGVTKFFKVDIPTKGNWKGFPFLFVQASNDFHPVRHEFIKNSILNRIKQNPVVAMERYGQLIGRCGMCGKTLTDEISRKRGIGPICEGRV